MEDIFDQGNKGESYSVIGDFGGSPVIGSNVAFAWSTSGQLLALNLIKMEIKYESAGWLASTLDKRWFYICINKRQVGE